MYAIVDIETTGSSYKGQKITEISIFIFNGNTIVDEFTSLVNPEQDIPPFITNLTGISNAMVRYAPKFHEIANKIEEITRDTIFVAHNVNFDYNIIKDEFKTLGQTFKRKKLCTVRLSRKIIPGLRSYSLGNLCAALEVPILERHRAKGDAEATVLLFQLLLNKDDNFIIPAFLNGKSKQATLPPLLPKSTVEKLPDKPGVYYFYNAKKEVIYIGKAIKIKQRVISHFYDTKKKEREMCLEIADISFEETGSELLALLLESSKIKSLYPTYNRAQKNKRDTFSLFSYEDQKGVLHIAYNKKKLIANGYKDFYSLQECRAFLEQLCKDFNLCPKYCHLQTNVKQCNHHQLNSCKGICSNKEAITTYNKRVNKALNSIGLEEQNLVILESGRTADETAFVLVLNGVYKGFGYLPTSNLPSTKNPEDYLWFVNPMKDNKEVQQILASYLQKKKELKIQPFSF